MRFALASLCLSLSVSVGAQFICELRVHGVCNKGRRRGTTQLAKWFDFTGVSLPRQQQLATCQQRSRAWKTTCGGSARVEYRVRRNVGHILEQTTAAQRASFSDATATFSTEGATGGGRSLPCCLLLGYSQPEANASSRCNWLASEGKCRDRRTRRMCPFSCGVCRHCIGTCTAEAMMQLRARAPFRERHAADAPSSPLLGRAILRPRMRDANISDNVWCTTFPRCLIFGCCRYVHGMLERAPRACTLHTCIRLTPTSPSPPPQDDLTVVLGDRWRPPRERGGGGGGSSQRRASPAPSHTGS